MAEMADTDNDHPLFVTSPLLPAMVDYQRLLDEIWESRYLTNDGPMCKRLESEIQQRLDVPTSMLFNNGTTALMCALKLFDLPVGGEIITTPLTFAATAHSISWLGMKPVFADVLPESLTINPDAVECAITPETTAILAVHVYGTVCEHGRLQAIADEHGLKLIYDAAHAFGTTIDGVSVAALGDASIFSFHATKLFSTLEGGLLTTPDARDQEKVCLLRNFGIKDEEQVVEVGINGKLNEVQAAFGLVTLPLVEQEKERRRALRAEYDSFLSGLPGVGLQPAQVNVVRSEQYYPVVIDADVFGRSRDDIYEELKAQSIFARKYFHPICTDFRPYLEHPIVSVHDVPYAETVKTQVLCLPFHSGVVDSNIETIRNVLKPR